MNDNEGKDIFWALAEFALVMFGILAGMALVAYVDKLGG